MEAVEEAVKEPVARDAEQLIQRVRRRTRKKFGAEEKIRVVIEGMKREIAISDLCRREGISTALCYSRLRDFMEAGKSRLKGDSLREANRGEVKALHREIGHLKELVAEQAIQLALLKKSLSVSGVDGTGE